MKGRTDNERRCNEQRSNDRAGYANGGAVRDIGGVSARPCGSNPHVLDIAKRPDGRPEARRDGGRCMADGGETGGASAARRLDRPAAGRKNGGGNWIAGAVKHPGALHKSLKVPQGEPIPAKALAKAAHSDNPTLARRARLAETLKGFHKKG